MGRHARALSARGYSVTGIERDADAIAKARELGGGPSYVQADVRNYEPDPGGFDAAIVMSQSFGYFAPATNRDLLGRLATGVRESGRIILDLWNPEFFAAHQGDRDLKTPNGVVRENKHLERERLLVRLDYPNGAHEEFEWQLFSQAQMKAVAQSVGLELVVACTDLDAATPPDAGKPRIQFVLERVGNSPAF